MCGLEPLIEAPGYRAQLVAVGPRRHAVANARCASSQDAAGHETSKRSLGRIDTTVRSGRMRQRARGSRASYPEKMSLCYIINLLRNANVSPKCKCRVSHTERCLAACAAGTEPRRALRATHKGYIIYLLRIRHVGPI